MPGASLVALMAELGAELAEPPDRLVAIERAVFRRPVSPVAPVVVSVRLDGPRRVRATVAHDGRPAASATLRYGTAP